MLVLYLDDTTQADRATQSLAELVSNLPFGANGSGGARIGIVSNLGSHDTGRPRVAVATDGSSLDDIMTTISVMRRSGEQRVASLVAAADMDQAILAAAGIDDDGEGDDGADWCRASFDAGFCGPFARPMCGFLQSVTLACPYTCSACAGMTPSACFGRTLQFTDADEQTNACRCAADCHSCSYSGAGHGHCTRCKNRRTLDRATGECFDPFWCTGVTGKGRFSLVCAGERLEARTVVVPIAVAGTTVPGIAWASGDYTVHEIAIPRSTPEPDADPTAVIRLQMRRFVRDICATYGHGGR